MRRKTFVIYALFVVFLAVLIPWLVFRSDGDAARGPQKVSAQVEGGQTLFQINCGTCHTLYAAGTDGNYGPNLDELLSPSGVATGEEIGKVKSRVLNAVENGVDSTTTTGRMPAGILTGAQAEEVAEFVAHTAGEG
jgi:mono/diheme cytochrome c family protein